MTRAASQAWLRRGENAKVRRRKKHYQTILQAQAVSRVPRRKVKRIDLVERNTGSPLRGGRGKAKLKGGT